MLLAPAASYLTSVRHAIVRGNEKYRVGRVARGCRRLSRWLDHGLRRPHGLRSAITGLASLRGGAGRRRKASDYRHRRTDRIARARWPWGPGGRECRAPIAGGAAILGVLGT